MSDDANPGTARSCLALITLVTLVTLVTIPSNHLPFIAEISDPRSDVLVVGHDVFG